MGFAFTNLHLPRFGQAAMESPSTKRAYAATLAASLGVANEEVPYGPLGYLGWKIIGPWRFP